MSEYKRCCPTIWGGQEYLRARRPMRSKFMDDLEVGPEAAERNRLRKVENVRKLMRDNARIFTKADSDGDGRLSFPEFCELVKLQAKLQRRSHILKGTATAKPGELPPMPSRTMLRDWFHLIDFNHSGDLSMTEFFGFSLREALARSAQTDGLESFLQIWDMNSDGKLDATEFSRVTAALGFASVTKEIMEMCQPDADGSVPITALTKALHNKAEGEESEDFLREASAVAQRPIEALWKQVGNKTTKMTKATKGRKATTWKGVTPKMDGHTSFSIISALNKVDLSARKGAFYDPREADVMKKENVGPALSILRSWLRTTGLRSLDIFQAWDVTGDFNLGRKELGKGLATFGLNLTEDLVTLVFDSMCEDHHMSYDEFKMWFDATKYSHLSDEERIERAVVYIQNAIRGRQARKMVAAKKLERQKKLKAEAEARAKEDVDGLHTRTDVVAEQARAVEPSDAEQRTRFPPIE